jgi:hypothetical protein
MALEAVTQKRGFSIIPSAGVRGLRGVVTTGLAGTRHRIIGSGQTAFRATATEVR